MTSPPKGSCLAINKRDCISQKEVESLQATGQQVLIIDVRNADEFAKQHIPQAINIPVEAIDNESIKLTKESKIITACGKGGGRSAIAATQLHSLGFTHTKWLCGGTFGWE